MGSFEIKNLNIGSGSYWKLKVENGSWKLEVGSGSYWKLKLKLEVGSWNFKFQISNLKIEN